MSATAREVRRLLRLAIPVIITQVSTMLLGVVDTLMVGHVGVKALGAASLGHVWIMGTLIFGMGVVFGIDPIVTQAHGRRDPERMARGLQRGIVLGVLLSIPLGALLFATAWCLRMLGQDPELASMAQTYAVVQLPSIPMFFVFTALRQYLQGRGIVAPAMWVAIVANGANVVFNWALIFGHLGLPAMGLTGAGIATALTRTFMLGVLILITLRGRLHVGGWVPWSRESFRLAGLREVFALGAPVGVHFALEIWAFQIATLMAGRLGTTELAAHTVALNMASLSFMLPLGISLGAVTRVGNLIGENRYRRAQRAAGVALALGAGVMTVSAVIFITLRYRLPHLYTDDAAAVAMTALILPIAAAFQLFDGTQVVGTAILRGMGRTRPAALFNLVGYYGLALPLAWWLGFNRGTGLPGVWWGLCLGLAAVALMAAGWVWRRGPATLEPPRRRPAIEVS